MGLTQQPLNRRPDLRAHPLAFQRQNERRLHDAVLAAAVEAEALEDLGVEGLGAEIRALEGFQRDPAPDFRAKDFVRLRSEATGPVGLHERDGEWFFCADETGRFDGLPPRVWEFAVSGYRVLKRWAEARNGLDGPTYWPQFRDVAARIHELLHWFDRADLVLEAVLADTLSRDELGLAPGSDDDSGSAGTDE